jgi:hypothetical protein|tara:strand:+ start:61 stop:1104 length:1044 start_codon:yes stop_codon:yes gene_type:complete
MQMKALIEGFHRFLSEEQPGARNIDKVLDFLSSFDVEVEQLSSTILRVRADDREEMQRLMEPTLIEMGYRWESNAPGAGFGRFVLLDKELGNVYLLLKPKTRRAAGVGADYEARVAGVLHELLPGFNIETAGFGAGSDLTISKNGKEMKLELKTSSGADFGQFKLKYDIDQREWTPVQTKKFIENADLYGGVFTQVLQPNLKDKHINNVGSPHYNTRGEYIIGLLRMPGTRNQKLALQAEWFGGKSDMKLQIDPALVQNYYALKGDVLIQIQGRGVYALTAKAEKDFEVLQLKDAIKTSRIRFRIKPHSGSDGVHSFTAALKVSLVRSPFNLEDPQFLEKIKNYLIS